MTDAHHFNPQSATHARTESADRQELWEDKHCGGAKNLFGDERWAGGWPSAVHNGKEHRKLSKKSKYHQKSNKNKKQPPGSDEIQQREMGFLCGPV